MASKRVPVITAQELRLAEALSRIEAILTTFVARFDSHERKDEEVAKAAERRSEANEMRTETRARELAQMVKDVAKELADTTDKQYRVIVDQTTELQKQVAELRTDVSDMKVKQGIFDGGRKAVVAYTGILISLLLGIAGILLQVFQTGK